MWSGRAHVHLQVVQLCDCTVWAAREVSKRSPGRPANGCYLWGLAPLQKLTCTGWDASRFCKESTLGHGRFLLMSTLTLFLDFTVLLWMVSLPQDCFLVREKSIPIPPHYCSGFPELTCKNRSGFCWFILRTATAVEQFAFRLQVGTGSCYLQAGWAVSVWVIPYSRHEMCFAIQGTAPHR